MLNLKMVEHDLHTRLFLVPHLLFLISFRGVEDMLKYGWNVRMFLE
jgi:hypothetical protein